MLNREELIRVGPQILGEPRLLRRLRLHQSWYRSGILGLTGFGSTPAPYSKPLGSILTLKDSELGHNFLSQAAQNAYDARRPLGWGLDPVRCRQYLTSSQALTLNLYGPLAADPRWLAQTFGTALGKNFRPVVHRAGLEYAPRRPSLHLNDQTRIDMYFELESDDARIGVAVETKYGDRFSSRFLDISHRTRYGSFNDQYGLWDTGVVGYGTRNIEQLARVHALSTSKIRQSGSVNSHLLLIHHSMDVQAREVADMYRATLVEPDLLTVTDLDSFLHSMNGSASNDQQRELVRRLKERYTDLHLSDEHWESLRRMV